MTISVSSSRLLPPPFSSGRAPSLALGLLALGLLGCGGFGEPGTGTDGPSLYRSQACRTCHGTDGAGTVSGPPLRDLGRHWKPGQLAEYLAAPDEFLVHDARLAEMSRRYSQRMAAFGHLDEAERLRLAKYVLALEAASTP